MATLLAWLTGFAKLIPLLDRLVTILQGRKLKAEGRAEAQAEQDRADLDAVKKVTDARRAARDSDGGVREDKYLRD
jgi:hypothetical protein